MSYAGMGFAFITCLLMGTGLGIFLNNVEIGGAIGLGLGLLILAMVRKKR